MPPIHTGDVVPSFTTQDQNGATVSLADYGRQPIVLFFYPRADTPGCTVEACAFRDIYAEILAAGAAVFGISRDTVKAQKKFADKFKLTYPLLADPDETICASFDLIKQKSMYGKMVKGVERTTYLIAPADEQGQQRLLHVWSKVKPEGHAEEVLAYLQQNLPA